MPTLLGLPNEVLEYIVNDLHIDDIETFSSCCKQIKLVAAARLGRHLAKKYKFPSIAIKPTIEHGDGISDDSSDERSIYHIPTYLLQDFLMDEENTLYPRSMSIEDIDTIRYDSEEMLSALVTTYIEEHHGLEDKIIAKVMQIQKSLFVEMPVVEAQDWINRIKNGNFDATAALLVTLFPNVKTLRVLNRPTLGAETLLVRTLERLTSAAAKTGPRALGAFGELSEVHFGITNSRNWTCGELIAMFMILPSMRIIKGRSVRWAFDWPHGFVASSVKELSLVSSQIHSCCFIDCLKHIKTLERFTYDMAQTYQTSMRWESQTHRFIIRWQPRLLVKALRKYAHGTLVHLELTGGVNDTSSDPADGEPFIGTLRSFQVLESLRLMTTMLFKQVDGGEVDESEDLGHNTLEDSVHPTDMVEPRRLVDFLPSSARKLELVGGLSNEEARDMFADLPKLKSERLPNLVEIVLEDCDPLEQETKNLCKDAGIRLKSIKRVVNGYQRIYAITKPTPQVDEHSNNMAPVQSKMLDA